MQHSDLLRRIFVAVALLALTACATVRNVSPPPIPVPSGLTEPDVELAILLAVADPPEPPDLTPGQQITDSVLTAIVGGYDSLSIPRQPWYFEAREPGAIFAGYQRGRYYMRVEVEFDTEAVSLSIADSRNLDQTETRIHAGAFTRLQTLENRIRRALGKVARRNTYGGDLD